MKTTQIMLLAFLLNMTTVHGQTILGTLTPGKTSSAKIKKKEKHRYQLELAKNQLALIVLQQKGVDLELTYTTPSGQTETTDGYNDDQGPEPLLLAADESGTFDLDVTVLQGKGSGAYDLVVKKITDITGNPIEDLDVILSSWEQMGYLPGFGVSLINADEILMQEGYGHADKSADKAYDIHTIQNIGSVSKTTLGISLMKLVEDGKLDLDKPVSDYVPFDVVNPHHPAIPITVRHLATHTSTISDGPHYDRSYVIVQNHNLTQDDVDKDEWRALQQFAPNTPLALGTYLENVFSESSDWYTKKSFFKHKPGSLYRYSNIGAGLAAYVVEQVAGMPYNEFTKKHIFDPLGMASTGWDFDEIDLDRHAKLYFANNTTEIPRYQLITYADGGLKTSIHDLSLYLQELIKARSGAGTLLGADSYNEMMRSQLLPENFRNHQDGNNAGLFWDIDGEGGEGHSGGDPGIVTRMYFHPDTQIGAILFTNCGLDEAMAIKQYVEIWKAIQKTSKVLSD